MREGGGRERESDGERGGEMEGGRERYREGRERERGAREGGTEGRRDRVHFTQKLINQ